jgi:hypothetical protein
MVETVLAMCQESHLDPTAVAVGPDPTTAPTGAAGSALCFPLAATV